MLPQEREFQIDLTGSAREQIKLIQENDYTIAEKVFRLVIGGKGCDGFTYEMGFSEVLPDDIPLHFGTEVTLYVDPFTAFYCKEGTLDFVILPDQNQEGFTFTNKNEHLYHGKFFKGDNLVPPWEAKE
jgi:iron-sulfur cluster assembly accessory protein